MSRVFTELPPLSLYVHLPWCEKKCPYCDFNSHEQRNEIPEDAYIDALLADLAEELPAVWGRTFGTVFIGGGTPSLFSGTAIDKLMSGIRALTGLSPSAEVTLEANPGSSEQNRFKEYWASGINRLSIGVQSFDSAALQALGRIHTSSEACKAVDSAHAAGFQEINLDLMFALPGQDITAALDDLQQALSLQPTHLSCYELTLEPNTLFARFPPIVPDNDQRADMQNAVVESLAQAGYSRYEISAYAKQSNTQIGNRRIGKVDHRSQHNLNYWQFGDYVGIGAGAHGKITSANTGQIIRRWKHKHPTRYLQAAHASERLGAEHIITIEDTALEFMMNALRLVDGFPIPLFDLHTGVSLMPWQPIIDRATQKGLLQQTGLNLHPTPDGINWLNELLELFLPEPSDAANGSNENRDDSFSTDRVRTYPVIPLNKIN